MGSLLKALFREFAAPTATADADTDEPPKAHARASRPECVRHMKRNTVPWIDGTRHLLADIQHDPRKPLCFRGFFISLSRRNVAKHPLHYLASSRIHWLNARYAMLDLTTETTISLAAATRFIPPGRGGKRCHLSTVLRWIMREPRGQTVS